MTNVPQQQQPDQGPGLQGAIEGMTAVRDGVELEVRLRNPLGRAIHYIADVRGMVFDAATGRLHVQLSDRGREMPPGGTAMQPQFRSVDPGSEAMARIRLPKTIVRLSATPAPSGEVTFEEFAVADATDIDVEIGWADTPFYRDPRERAAAVFPVSAWEQRSLTVTYRPTRADKDRLRAT
jgi:hypothetical protein